mmetsp:Transcript_6301/g.8331  ORF Transcript_6301/g.8331 Transcript_6301/m.8331 type:complete len:155 (+) Transcript_6301:491-955(+)
MIYFLIFCNEKTVSKMNYDTLYISVYISILNGRSSPPPPPPPPPNQKALHVWQREVKRINCVFHCNLDTRMKRTLKHPSNNTHLQMRASSRSIIYNDNGNKAFSNNTTTSSLPLILAISNAVLPPSSFASKSTFSLPPTPPPSLKDVKNCTISK